MIDAHTHDARTIPGIQKIIVKDFARGETINGDFQCIGIHPWSLSSIDEQSVLNKFETYLKVNKPWALGEMGIDKAIKTSIQIQSASLYHQIELAKRYKINRIIIHCVKAYNEVFHELKMSNYQGQVLLHDFNENELVAKQFLNYFDCYFSIGVKIFDSNTTTAKNFEKLPIDKILLETDDQKEKSISEIYTEASLRLGKTVDQLTAQLKSNFESLAK